MLAKTMTAVPVRYDVFPLSGGLDLVTPTTSLKPGVARDAENFEVSVTGGYSRIRGYERYDGRVGNPSDATFNSMTLDTLGAIAVGTAISNGAGATGVVIQIDGLLVHYTKQVGAFAGGNTVNGTSLVVSLGATLTERERKLILAKAADEYRDDILVVPGSGNVRGVAVLNSTLYAWRDNAGGTALDLYKATTGGWSQVLFPYELSFTASGTTPIVDGASIANGAGATGTVARVVIETGTWAAGTAAGRLILSATAGTWASGNNIQVSAVTRATVTPPAGTTLYTASARLAYSPGGRVQTMAGNFGSAQATKLYGCDNVNRGFEFDGTTFIPIRTGMATDTPTNVAVHKNHLWFSFGPSLQASGLGTPYAWTVVAGALELLADDTITALQVLPGDQTAGALGVLTATKTNVLYGSSTLDFKLTSFNTGFGAAKYSTANLEQTYMLAERGVVGMATTQAFANFDASTLTLQIRPLIAQYRSRVAAAGVNRERAQYRVFFNDGVGLYLTINNGRLLGVMPVLFAHPVTCWCEGLPGQTAEAAFFGSDDGYVRRMDAGTSFDGQVVDFRLLLNFDHMGNPRILKRFRKAALEVAANDYTEFAVGYSLAYADVLGKDQPLNSTYTTQFSVSALWDQFDWDSINWDGVTLGPTEVEIQGSAENIAMAIEGSSAAFDPFTINTITIHYTPRRGLR